MRGLIGIAIIFIALVNSKLAFSDDGKYPPGWRALTLSEIKSDDWEWRKSSPTYFLSVSQDFNGDKILDSAKVLVNTETGRLAIYAFVTVGGESKIYKLVEFNNFREFTWLGISAVPPGKYVTACGKGYYACVSGEPKELKIINGAINFFKDEGANRFIFWNEEKKGFQEAQMSD